MRAGLERPTPHDLRHPAASLAVSAGANLKVFQRMLGHSLNARVLASNMREIWGESS
jgi:site-specific recombinase XerD